MTKRNITLTSILLLVLVIIGIILITAKPRALGVVSLGLRAAVVTPATYPSRLSVLGMRPLAGDAQAVNDLEVGVLKVDALNLTGASLNLLSA